MGQESNLLSENDRLDVVIRNNRTTRDRNIAELRTLRSRETQINTEMGARAAGLGRLGNIRDSLDKAKTDRTEEIEVSSDSLASRFMQTLDDLSEERVKEQARADSLRVVNDSISSVFMGNTLINNISAIGVLESWRKASDSDPARVAISEKVTFVRWLLIILILFVDTAPVIIKLLTPYGSYEAVQRRLEYEKTLEQQQYTHLADAELAANEALIVSLSESQRKVVTEAIENWEEQEKNNMGRNYRNYVVDDETDEEEIDDVDELDGSEDEDYDPNTIY